MTGNRRRGRKMTPIDPAFDVAVLGLAGAAAPPRTGVRSRGVSELWLEAQHAQRHPRAPASAHGA